MIPQDPKAPQIHHRYVFRTMENAGKVRSTADRLYHYLLHGFSALGVIRDSPVRTNRSVIRMTYQGEQYKAILRVCNGEIQVFRDESQTESPDKFPLRKRGSGVGQVKKIFERILANGVCPEWKAKNDLRLAAEAEKRAEKKKTQDAITRTRTRILKATPFPRNRLILTDVTPDKTIGAITLKGPWTPEDVISILRHISNEGLA